MLMYNIHIEWKRETSDFEYHTYNRKHTVFFNGGPKIEINSSANLMRNPQFHCPEELLIASLSSCLLLTFLALCSKEGYVVDHYSDQGYCQLDEKAHCVSDVVLCPVVLFAADNMPDKKILAELFHKAHSQCFIANSLKAAIRINPTLDEHTPA